MSDSVWTRVLVRWLRYAAIVAVLIVLVFAFGGWLRGQDQWGPFSGQVVDAETGAPIANANVMVAWNIPRFGLVDSLVDFYDARETVTDADGRFEIPRLWRMWSLDVRPPGLGFFAPGYITVATDVTLPDGVPFVDPTQVKLAPLRTREERCARRPGAPLHGRAPMYRASVLRYRSSLDC
jgi:hypothetical protein